MNLQTNTYLHSVGKKQNKTKTKQQQQKTKTTKKKELEDKFFPCITMIQARFINNITNL